MARGGDCLGSVVEANMRFRTIVGLVVLLVFAVWVTRMVWPEGYPSAWSSRVDGASSGSESPVVVVTHLYAYSVVGKPTVSASFLDQVLVAYGSPAVGKGQRLYDLGVQYGIDPVYAFAFFLHESRFGTTGEARASRSLGNLRCVWAGYEDLQPVCRDGYSWFSTWEAGFEAWYRLVKVGYVQGGINAFIGRHACPCLTVSQIIPVYAPGSDGNDVAGYIAAVEHAVDMLRAGRVKVS